MVDLSLLQSVSYMAGAFGVCVAAIYYVINLRISQRNQEVSLKTQELALKSQQQNLETRQAQLFMVMYEKWIAPDFIESNTMIHGLEVRDSTHFQELFHDSRVESRSIVRAGAYFEGLGVLVREELIDVRLVSLFLYGEVKLFWEKWGSFLKEQRVAENYPRAWIEAEYLYDRVMDYGRSHLQQN